VTGQTSDEAHAGDDGSSIELISAERLVFFSDAVVAIAITLLALALPLPHGATSRAVFKSMWAGRDAYLAFLISFVVIANYWRYHHRLFRSVVRLDGRIITINLIWLLLIVVTPFATRLISGSGGLGARFTVYAVIQVATILGVLAMSLHIRSGHLLRVGAPDPTSRTDEAALLALAGTFAASIPVALATESQWTFVIWVGSAFTARFVRRLRSHNSL
jgi:uncharacterized membrane protein